MAKQKDSKLTPEEIREQRQLYIDIICAATATSEKGLKRLCDAAKANDSSFPACRTMRAWIEEDDGFKAQYARAKEQQADYIFDQILDIADDDSQDAIFVEGDEESGKSAKMVKNKEFMERSRLRVDARKWVVSKLLPRKYGDKQSVEFPDKEGNPQNVGINIYIPSNGRD